MKPVLTPRGESLAALLYGVVVIGIPTLILLALVGLAGAIETDVPLHPRPAPHFASATPIPNPPALVGPDRSAP
jgi:hypothetical protein